MIHRVLRKKTEDLRDVVVLDVAGDGGPGADIPGCVQTEQIRIEGALRKGDLVAFILETELDAWGWTVAKLELVAEPVSVPEATAPDARVQADSLLIRRSSAHLPLPRPVLARLDDYTVADLERTVEILELASDTEVEVGTVSRSRY